MITAIRKLRQNSSFVAVQKAKRSRIWIKWTTNLTCALKAKIEKRAGRDLYDESKPLASNWVCKDQTGFILESPTLSHWNLNSWARNSERPSVYHEKGTLATFLLTTEMNKHMRKRTPWCTQRSRQFSYQRKKNDGKANKPGLLKINLGQERPAH